ncbi:MAG: hypothetical protein A2Y00_07720 [Omnitrophica WOR_2 bacterium GWF2_43_52]|nr:MAG: hypothetical protein A2Y01_01250 [Omnitrophica WOR_2 bacterium GWC2_44_8]OGX21333.1 MAG: hypothetical protein A2Y00_07720 [Omnitrophica WOR_2 bacterium GWF2_43_52]OGX56565.1 MAG: hypothetical protein A2460_03045 [Omnitrophica WOR_2 bacterium RIFOXYC2_FULL_43_9]HAH22049.1 hypothetical protein [Candidatus Omnitrophota bacterium]HBG62726.1 hypothetical protein [Candidatus Omnitrophota bacterium]
MEPSENIQRAAEKDIRFAEPTFIDPLTRLYNQYYLFQFLPEEIKKANLGNYSLAVFMIDLDGFKYVNDTYGHLCGDDVLKQMAEILKKSVRQTDMVIRYAGDEFTILLPGVDLARVEKLSGQLIENVAKNPFKGLEGESLNLTISMGFAMCPEDGTEVDRLIELADKALYLSKQRGKNRVSQAKEVTQEKVSSLIALDSFPCPAFIDRRKEIDTLANIFDTKVSQDNSLQMALISGDAGIGKSRLLTELNNYVHDKAVVIGCHASLTHKGNPYFLFAQGISNYIQKIGPRNPQLANLLANVPIEEVTELSRIIPLLAPLVGSSQEVSGEDKKARFLLFKGLLDFFIELTRHSAVVFSFDDLQWADKASIELLRYLSKQEKNRRIFIVCSLSGDSYGEAVRDNYFRPWQEELSLMDNVAVVKLSTLSSEDASKMVDAIFPGTGRDGEFCKSLYAATKGNPSFIEEVLKSLVENSVILYQDNRWMIKKELYNQGTSFSLEEIIKKRLKSLDEETKEMIVQAAVIGEDFSLDFLRKIDNRDEGFMLELLNRAKKMRLIDETEQKGKYGFINKNIQHMLYNELNEEERAQLHHKIANVLGQEHKDNLSQVAGEMAFHYTQAPGQEKSDEFRRTLLEKASELFSPVEIVEYLDNLSKKAPLAEEKVLPLTDEALIHEAVRFVRMLQNARKVFHLYPPGAMRINAVQEAFGLVEHILKSTAMVVISQSERRLLLNGEAVIIKEVDQASVESFLQLLLEYNIQSLSFKNGIIPEELNIFLDYASAPSEKIKEKGGWGAIFNKETMKSLKVNDARFAQPAGQEKESGKKDKLKDMMLMEFFLGKAGMGGIDKKTVISTIENEPQSFARTLQEAAKESLKEGKTKDEAKAVTESIEKIHSQIFGKQLQKASDPKALARIIIELEPGLRTRVIRLHLKEQSLKTPDTKDDMLYVLPEAIIVEALIVEYKESQGNLIVVKACFDKAFGNDAARKQAALALLEVSLGELQAEKSAAPFIGGQFPWENVSLPARLETLASLPDNYYPAELGKIKLLLEELTSHQKPVELEKFISHLLAKVGKFDPLIRKDIIMALSGVVKTSLCNDTIDSLKMQDRLGIIWKLLKAESQPREFRVLLDILRDACRELASHLQLLGDVVLERDKPEVKKYVAFIRQLCFSLGEAMQKEKNSDSEICKLAAGFIKDIVYGRLLEVFAYAVVSASGEERAKVKILFPFIYEKLADAVIAFHASKDIKFGDSFSEYAIIKGSADVLLELGEPALHRLKQKLSQARDDISVSLIELIKHLNKEELIEPLSSLIHHKNQVIRYKVIVALAAIGTQKAHEVLVGALKGEKDKRMRSLLKDEVRKLKAKR